MPMPSTAQQGTSQEDQDGELPAPGHRWGSGAQSVLPYLTKSLQAKPASAADARDATRPPREGGSKPVFSNWPPARPRA
ncbi:MAG: hypothetical protein JWQ76_5318 [Ramlibacter sp.]|nr:hypothetical protein [Ramlibacter sp.]